VRAPQVITRGKRKEPARVFLYAPEGLGKSTFAAESPAPVFLDVERGTMHLDVARIKEGFPWTWKALLETVRNLATDGTMEGYQTLVLDTVDMAEHLAAAYLVEEHKPRSKEGLTNSLEAFGFGKGFNLLADQWKLMAKALEDVRVACGVNVILLGHAVVKTFKNPAGEDYDRYIPRVADKSAGIIKAWCDAVVCGGYETVQDKKSGKAVSTGARVVHTEWSPAWDAKNRYNLPAEVPLDAADFWRLVAEGRALDAATLRSQCLVLLAQVSDVATADRARKAVAGANDDPVALERLAGKLRGIIQTQANEEDVQS
jgi:hypothetical protein